MYVSMRSKYISEWMFSITIWRLWKHLHRFSSLDLVGEAFNKLFIDDAVGGCKGSKDVRYKVPLIVVEMVVP